MNRGLRLVAIALLALAAPLAAQERAPHDGGRIPSLGQPGYWKWMAGAAMGAGQVGGDAELTSELRATVNRDLGNPVIGLASFQFEGYGGTRDGEFDGGARARLVFPFTRLGLGVDHNLAVERTQFVLSLTHPVRRSGLFTDGSVLRLDWAPAGAGALALGFEKPIQRRIPPGATRPGRDHARLSARRGDAVPVPSDPAVRDALAEARGAARFIGTYTVPWLDHPTADRPKAERAVVARIDELKAGLAGGAPGAPRTLDTEVRRFHAALERAFTGAVGDATLGAAVAGRARSVLLDEVLLPYDRLIGQYRREDSTHGLALRARGILLRWLHTESGVPRERIDPALGVFAAVLGMVEEERAAARARWRDPRNVWLPLQFALLPEEHDTQQELDALVERATGERFSDGNFVSWVINEQFQLHFARTVRQAEEYHVLWIHDVRGMDDGLDPDELSFRQVVRTYLGTLTARVRAYDRTGRIPAYLILLDEWFYQVRKTRPWMDLLEDPLGHALEVPAEFAAWKDTLRAAQAELRAAIRDSRLLQAQRAEYGDDWLRDLVKVHVNITNAADHTFWSRHLARGVPVPDNMLRDHRKLVFYDITEDDPYRGEAIYTGAGIGEHYANLSWEDRALLVSGPAALGLKTAARELLLGQGVRPDRIPHPLRAKPLAADYYARVRAATQAERRSLRAVGLQNATGFGEKGVNVGKAVLYTLMPSGSVIKVPDSLWNSPFWASALAGCALRGSKVLVIAPALANAPAPAFGSMEHSYEMLWRLLSVHRRMAPELAERGGALRVGMYASTFEVTDILGKVRAVRQVFDGEPWLRDFFGFPPNIYPELDDLARRLEALGKVPVEPGEYEYERTPKLHLKANAFASREAWQLMTRPEWVQMTWEFILQRIAQVQTRREGLRTLEPQEPLLDVGDGTVQRWFEALPSADRERVVFYTVVGSHNQNARSFVMDGEAALVMSGWPAVIPYIDLISLVGQSRWLDGPEELAALLPPQGSFATKLSHWFRLAF